MTKTKKRPDLIQLATIAVVGLLVLGGLWVLEIDIDKIASVPLERWALIAAAIAGFLGTVGNAFRDHILGERSPAPKPDAPSPTEGSARLEALIAIPICAALVAVALAGCGAGALQAHARASSILVVALEGADELADTSAEIALNACAAHDTTCEDDVARVTEAIDAGIASASLPVGAYVQGVQLALAGGEDPDVVGALAVTLARVLEAWNELAPLFAPFGVELPALPESILSIVRLFAPPGDAS